MIWTDFLFDMNYDDWKLDENYPELVDRTVSYEAVIDCKLREAANIVASFKKLGSLTYEIDGNEEGVVLTFSGEFTFEVDKSLDEDERDDEGIMLLREEIKVNKIDIVELNKE